MRRRYLLLALVLAGLALGSGGRLGADDLNMEFPVANLIKGAKEIHLVRLGKAADGKMSVQIVRTLKGKAPAGGFTIDLTKAPTKEYTETLGISARMMKEYIKEFKRIVASAGDEPALLLIAKAPEKGEWHRGLSLNWNAFGLPRVLLHFSGRWFSLRQGKNGILEFLAFNENMAGTWEGGTDMLIRAVEYVLKVPDAVIPSETNAEWIKQEKIGAVKGKGCDLQAVDLTRDGKMFLFVASKAGDRLYAFDPKAKKYVDVTAARKLGSKSVRAAWGDFDADGRLDLASWGDGKGMYLWLQAKNGTFAKSDLKADWPSYQGMEGVTTLDVGSRSGAGLVVSTLDAPTLLVPQENGVFLPRRLTPPKERKDLGKPGPCLVADFDGDAIPDVIQPFEKAGIFYRGKGAGAFEAGKFCAVALGKGSAGASIGDFDQDGKLDVLTANRDGDFHLWNNRGGGKFVDTFWDTGEPTYIAPRQRASFAVRTGDVNSDGREDFLVLYASTEEEDVRRHPYVFFNRGFRCFRHAHMLDIFEHEEDEGYEKLAPEARKGVRAGLLADLDGDGRQEMALVLAGGGLWVLKSAAADPLANELFGEEPIFALTVALPPGIAGPVTVTARSLEEKRSFGARVATAARPAFFGVSDEGAVEITWQLPGGEPQRKELDLGRKPVRFVLPAKK